MQRHLVIAIGLVAGCGGTGAHTQHAAGTYVGGGSYLVGPDDCTYTGSAGVFGADSATPERGPRFVRKPGTITVTCPKTTYTEEAVEPTGARIYGPDTVAAGTTSELFTSYLVAGGEDLRGEASLEWTLGDDCKGIATFDTVYGAQDTGGRDRSRQLVATAKGTCTVKVALVTGSLSAEDFVPQTFRTSKRVTIH
jgi:hypothetical protein